MQKLAGFTEAGNTTLTITGAAGTIARKVQGSFPSCTVTVYLAGTVTLAAIFADNADSPTVKANPFVAGSDGTWFFYTADGRYDVQFSGGGIGAPFTIGDLQAFDVARPNNVFNVNEFGAPTDTFDVKFNTAYNALAAISPGGGILDCTGCTGAWSAVAKMTVAVSNVTIRFSPSMVLSCSGVAPVQSPWGSNFFFTGDNIWMVCDGGRAQIKADTNSLAALVTWFHGAVQGGARNIEFNGNKANQSVGIADDNFGVGVDIISDTTQGAAEDTGLIFEGCLFHDFINYGSQTFGNRSGANTWRDCWFYSNGKAATAGSVGDGLFLTYACSYNLIDGCRSFSNKAAGFHFTAASDAGITPGVQFYNKVSNSWSYNNGSHGFFMHEESAFGSMVGTEQLLMQLVNCHAYTNGAHGFYFVSANLGSIQSPSMTNCASYLNTGFGLLVQSVDATNKVSQLSVDNCQFKDNVTADVFLGSFTLDTKFSDNFTSTVITDNATRTLDSGTKIGAVDNIFRIAADLAVAGLARAANFDVLVGEYRATQLATRTWALLATGGNWAITSGDGLGALNASVLYGIRSSGPISVASDVYANRPGNGTRAAQAAVNGMVMVFTDSTTATQGANIAGGGANNVLAWYNSSVSQWHVASF